MEPFNLFQTFALHAATFTPQQSANMSMFFDLGGIMGGMTAGALSDKFKKPACL